MEKKKEPASTTFFCKYYILHNFGIPPNYKDALLVHKQQIKATSKTKDMCRNIHYTLFFLMLTSPFYNTFS